MAEVSQVRARVGVRGHLKSEADGTSGVVYGLGCSREPADLSGSHTEYVVATMTRLAAALTTALVIGLAGCSGSGHQASTPTTATGLRRGLSTSFALDPRVRACFADPHPHSTMATPSLQAGTKVPERLLVLTKDGALWVVEGNKATLWSGATNDLRYSGIVWARWLNANSILTARGRAL